ncbi:TNT domain-containing protein [Clostridium sporogenes]|nr:glycohydrolase toxin TNT-related protein [Clostridium sporogenes]
MIRFLETKIINKKSLDDIIEKARINSLDDLTRIGVTSAEDLSKLGVNSVDDLAKLGINNIDELSKLGISSEDLSRVGIKGVNKTNKYSLSGEEHYESLKDLFGADNVEWTSKNTISNYERLKLSGWGWTPKDELYLKYKDVYNNDLYYNQATGNINWPKNNGFIEEFPGYETLNSGTLLDRYGESAGNFFAPATDAYETRALAPHSETANHYYYRLLQNFEVTSGKAAPWFGSTGGAKQYIKYNANGKLYTIDELIDEGLIEDVTDLVKEGLIK